MRDVTETHHRELGKIDSIDIVDNDHGGYALQITFDFGGGGQSFVLGLTQSNNEGLTVAAAMAGESIIRIMLVFGASKLSAIAGRYAYALKDINEPNGFIRGIQTLEPDGGRVFLTKDIW